MKNARGFTLIELIMVIVILGILAAVALPKFSDLQVDARIAALNGALGAVKSASAISHSTALVRNAQEIKVEGKTYTMVNYYPAATDIAELAGLDDTFTVKTDGGKATISLKDSCSFTYTQAIANETPGISDLDTSNC